VLYASLYFDAVLNTLLALASMVCGAGSMQRSGVRLSVCLSHPIDLRRICCCGPGEQEISIDCCTASGRRPAATAPQERAAADCGQGHVVSRRRKLNIDSYVCHCWQYTVLLRMSGFASITLFRRIKRLFVYLPYHFNTHALTNNVDNISRIRIL